MTNDSSNRAEVIEGISPKDYHISFIENKKNDLAYLDGVLVYFNHENWLSETIDWILLLRKERALFIWVLLPKAETKQKNICFQLGANSVLCFPTEQQFIPYVVANTFSCIANRHQQLNEETEFTLVENDLSMIVGSKEKALTSQEYKVLALLIDNEDRTVSYEDFAQNLWPEKEFHDSYEMRSYIANIMFHIRKKLNGSQWSVQTTREKGYRLNKEDDKPKLRLRNSK